MDIHDCVNQMSKLYLSRIVDSLIREDIPRHNENRLREQILQNTSDLADHQRIASQLDLGSLTRPNRILLEEILVSLLELPQTACKEDRLYDLVKEREQSVIEQSRGQDAFVYSDPKSLDIYDTVLETALEDDNVSSEEFVLLEPLRKKLKISRLEHRLLEAKQGKFPRAGNEVHSFEDFKNAVKKLQSAGILFYCNQADDGPLVVLPEEIASGVRSALGFEMRAAAQRSLYEALSNDQLRRILKAFDLPISGSKQERSARLVKAGCKPSEVLDVLQNNELGDLCRKLHGLKVSGSKEARRDRIVDYFASLTAKEPETSEDPRSVSYQYLEELAARKSQELRRLDLIKHDREMERRFEDGTRYLFEVKLGYPLIGHDGVEHADGGVAFPDGQILLWDNKCKESIYTFPRSHADQFRRYIEQFHQRGSRVSAFLVVVPEVEPEAEIQAVRLKNETYSDTDVALITASDLKFVAENWPKYSQSGSFNLKIFNSTGILGRQKLEGWMQSLL